MTDRIEYHGTPDDRTPKAGKENFDCPTCHVYAEQINGKVNAYIFGVWRSLDEDWSVSECRACGAGTVWRGEVMVWPRTRTGPAAHADTPSAILPVYEEARAVWQASDRAAAALLRLALQMLVDSLIEGNKNLDAKIGELVRQGLDSRIQKAMDTLRVVGNNAVHPGQLSSASMPELTPPLFELFNLIVEQTITRPRHIDALFESLPDGAREAIDRRDQSSAAGTDTHSEASSS